MTNELFYFMTEQLRNLLRVLGRISDCRTPITVCPLCLRAQVVIWHYAFSN